MYSIPLHTSSNSSYQVLGSVLQVVEAVDMCQEMMEIFITKIAPGGAAEKQGGLSCWGLHTGGTCICVCLSSMHVCDIIVRHQVERTKVGGTHTCLSFVRTPQSSRQLIPLHIKGVKTFPLKY